MDNLVTILSNINWEKVDPDLVDTRDNLKSAQTKLASLKDGGTPAEQAEVTREIEKLEAFVTSPKFDYVDLAQKR